MQYANSKCQPSQNQWNHWEILRSLRWCCLPVAMMDRESSAAQFGGKQEKICTVLSSSKWLSMERHNSQGDGEATDFKLSVKAMWLFLFILYWRSSIWSHQYKRNLGQVKRSQQGTTEMARGHEHNVQGRVEKEIGLETSYSFRAWEQDWWTTPLFRRNVSSQTPKSPLDRLCWIPL